MRDVDPDVTTGDLGNNLRGNAPRGSGLANFQYKVSTPAERAAHIWSLIVVPIAYHASFHAAFWTTLALIGPAVWGIGWISVVFLLGLPFLPLLVQFRRGVDFDVSDLSVRRRVFLETGAIHLVGVVIMAFFPLYSRLEFVLVLFAVYSFTFGVISRWWKISHHAGSATLGMLGAALLVSPFPFVQSLLWISVPIVVGLTLWSRLALNRHTSGQLVAGTLVSTGLVFLVFSLGFNPF